MFFWFIPAETALGANELTLWSNGGPGCSSMIGAFQENGPVSLSPRPCLHRRYLFPFLKKNKICYSPNSLTQDKHETKKKK
jgi:hypothetical protein